MKIVFENQEYIEFNLIDSPLENWITKCFKHLQLVDIKFSELNNPYYIRNTPYDIHIKKMQKIAEKLSIDLDLNRMYGEYKQPYCNYLHEIYEKNYDGTPNWLILHEMIHLCEEYNTPDKKTFFITYYDKSSYLDKSFSYDYTKNMTTMIKKGDIFLKWAELGKKVYTYWKDKEPNDINRMKELAKPWVNIRPLLNIALEDADMFPYVNKDEFNDWWKDYKDDWCAHYKLPDWKLEDMNAAIIIGNISDTEKLIELLKNNVYPQFIRLK
jgi:hypothetical protein